MTLDKHLHKRPNSPNWHIRLAVPTSLQAELRKTEITKSTKTSDRKFADVFAMKFISEQRAMFARMQEDSDSLVPTDLNGKIVELYYQKFLDELRLRKQQAGITPEAYANWCKRMDRQRLEIVRLANIKDHSRIRPIAEKFMRRHGFAINTRSDEFVSLLARMMIAIVDAFDVVLREANGELEAKPSSSFVTGTIASTGSMAKDEENLTDLLEKYAKEQIDERNRKPSNVEQEKAAISLFIEWAGPALQISSLTKRDATGYREILSKIPKGRGSNNRLKSVSISRCIQIARERNLGLLSTGTKNRYIYQLSAFFRWMQKRGYCSDNIWIGMSFDVDKQDNRRPAFTNEQLNNILASPLYAGFLKDGKEHKAGKCKATDWRYWLPLLCMFTGARITEIAQLYVDDIEESQGCLIGYLRADTERGQSIKTKQSARLVVFHATLLDAGFKEYWQQQVRRSTLDGNMQLFPELKTGKRPELGRRPARWWRDYLTKIGVKNGADGIGTHSFRHRLADEMRMAGYTNEEFGRLILGHSDGSMTAAYGDLPQGTVERLRTMIEAVKFEAVDFSNILSPPK